MKFLFFTLFVGIVCAQNDVSSKLKLPSIISDNMVLQQNTDVPLWGQAKPGMEINVISSWNESARVITCEDGNWLLRIKSPSYGGPYQLKIISEDSIIVIKNIMIGEVWLCSGQSNMEMPLAGWPPKDLILNSDNEIANANYPLLRLFTVNRAFSTDPQKDCIGNWSETSPESAFSFSATAFYFGKKLLDELKMPIGLIHSSWGGTPVEAWTNGKSLSELDYYKEFINKLENSKGDVALLNDWLNKHRKINVLEKKDSEKWRDLTFDDSNCSERNYDDSKWLIMELPTLWENSELGNFDGVVWFRKQIEIPASWLHKNIVLELGPIDDMDLTYVNGVLVGKCEENGFWQLDRKYLIPAEVNTNKYLLIAVRVMDNQGGGGIYGSADNMKLYLEESNDPIKLNGEWKYLPVAEYLAGKFFVLGETNLEFYNRPKLQINLLANTPTTLYNGMIAPIIPFGIKGVIWYQGESNTGNPIEYKTLFPLMIKNWREDWAIGNFPFYYVQIAPYDYGTQINSQLLREVQFHSLTVPNTGMAVTMDIGNPTNVHPSNKKDVGERLARWALAKDYHKNIPYSGPLYKSMIIEKNNITLSFSYASGLYIKLRDGKNNFQIAGDDKVFYDADVNVMNNNLIVSSPYVKKPVTVRYCWGNTLEGTLFNEYNLPSPSFRTDSW